MAHTGKQSPIGINVLGGILQNRCLQINKNAEYYMGISRSNSTYTFGHLIEGTVLRMLTWSINDAFIRGQVSDATYNNLISISGDGACPALGNAKPPTYVIEDSSGIWTEKSLAFAGLTTANVGSFLIGPTYTIVTVGNTDFTALGAADNIIGIEFVATASGLVNSGNFVVTQEYIIASLGTTDWETAGATEASEFTAEIVDTTMTVTAMAELYTPQNLAVGDQLYGPNDLEPGTIITAQVSGAPGGVGEYTVDIDQSVSTDTFKSFKVGQRLYAVDVGDGTGTATQGTGTVTSPALVGPANAGYSVEGDTNYGQSATWAPYDTTNTNKSITQWGWIRCHALQAHNEFNWHASEALEGQATPKYEDFTASFSTVDGYINYTNSTIQTALNADTFLEGSFSNMDDLMTSDFAGVSKALKEFGLGLEHTGKLIDLKRLDRFGYPSTLLQQLYVNGGITQDLNLLLGGAGLPATAIKKISKGQRAASVLQEKQIYSAFLAITGENLYNCIAPLTSYWQLLTSDASDYPIRTLADCLDVKRLFQWQNVWSTLTVPVYNTTLNMPTGSKTYYLIYNSDGSVNSAINTNGVKKIVGTLVVSGTPTVRDDRPENIITETVIGFDSYLGGPNIVIPTAIGLAAAAFRYTMLQISNIEQITPGNIGGCISGLEINSNNGSGANGTAPETTVNDDGTTTTTLAKPINETLQSEVALKIAQGSGVGGLFTHSDFFGCMSGLPYAWNIIYREINKTGVTQTTNRSTLARIYQQLYLAVTWEQAIIAPIYTGTGPYTVTGWTIVDSGGGYGRAGAATPTIAFSDGLTGTATIGRSDKDTGSNGAGTFGRVTTITGATGTIANIPTATIESPPSAQYTAFSTSGVNGGTINYDTVVQDYIDEANAEIINIVDPDVGYTGGVEQLNLAWNVLGRQLKVEQRSRYIALNPVEVPRDGFVNSNQNIISFVDSMPEYSQDVRPHMSAQTIEMIVDRDCDVGQNMVAMMRQERNQMKLTDCGIPMNNNIPDQMPDDLALTLIVNNTAPGAIEGIKTPAGIEYTNPSWPVVEGNYIAPEGIYVAPIFYPVPAVTEGDYTPIIEGVDNPQVSSWVTVGPPSAQTQPPTVAQPASTAEPVVIKAPKFINPKPSTIPVGQPTIDEAIETVIHCNCDCWELIN